MHVNFYVVQHDRDSNAVFHIYKSTMIVNADGMAHYKEYKIATFKNNFDAIDFVKALNINASVNEYEPRLVNEYIED